MNCKSVILLGGGGHARVIHLFLTRQGYTIPGYVGPAAASHPSGTDALVWLGDDDWLAARAKDGTRLANGIGSAGCTYARRRAFDAAVDAGYSFVDFYHTTAILDEEMIAGDGLQVLAGAIVQPGCRLGRNVLVNTAAILEHDVLVGDHVHVAPHACLCGGVQVGTGAHIGAGAVIKQGCVIGSEAVIGAGSVVISDVPSAMTFVGNPARPTGKGKTDA